MENEVLKLGLTQGAFAALFIWLLIDTRKDGKQREQGYQDTIRENQSIIIKLTEKFNIVSVVSDKVDKIEFKVEEILRKEK